MEHLVSQFTSVILAFTYKQLIMMGVGAALMYLAIVKEFEPNLLLPMGFGTILVNIPFTSALDQMAGGKLTEGAHVCTVACGEL